MRYILIIIFFLAVNCSATKTSNLHGNLNLDQKIERIKINKHNKNDIINSLGSPSLISSFNKNQWFYVERKKVNQSILKLGIQKINKNNVLIIRFDNRGILIEKDLLDLDSMKNIKFSENITNKEYEEKSYVYEALNSLRERLNSPAKNRRKDF